MEALTVLGVCAIGASVLGFLFYNKEHKKGVQETNITPNYSTNVTYAFSKTLVSPDNKLKAAIDSAQNKLDIAIYTITDKAIAQRILQATDRGVKVRILTDSKQTNDVKYQLSLIMQLIDHGIPVKVNTHQGLMHLKVTIIDDSVVTTGSYNFTKAAKEKHDEVFVVINDEKIAKDWAEHFEILWNDSKNYHDFLSVLHTNNKAS